MDAMRRREHHVLDWFMVPSTEKEGAMKSDGTTPRPWVIVEHGDGSVEIVSHAYYDEEPGIASGSRDWPLTKEDAHLIIAALAAYDLAASKEEWDAAEAQSFLQADYIRYCNDSASYFPDGD